MKLLKHSQLATFANGCFWCTEAIFQRLKGVTKVTPGYTGGTPPAGGKNPTYEQVCSGTTGHAESLQIEFNPKQISYETLLEVFFATHDPTSLNRQGYDIGTQYRSAIFYHNEKQKQAAEKMKQKLNQAFSSDGGRQDSSEVEAKVDKSIVTQIVPFTKFYPAETTHQNYYNRNQSAPYCQVIINPKIQSLLSQFPSKLKPLS